MQTIKISKRKQIIAATLVALLTAAYLLTTTVLARTSQNTGYNYSEDPLSWGDVYSFDNAAFSGTNYSNLDGKSQSITYYNNASNSNGETGTAPLYNYVGNVKYDQHTAPADQINMLPHTAAQFRNDITMDAVNAPIGNGVTIPVATTTGTGIYSIVPGSTGDYVVYVYSPSGAPSNVKYSLINSYTAANAYTSSPSTALTFTAVGTTGWYYSNNVIGISNLGWTAYKTSFNKDSGGEQATFGKDSNTGTHAGKALTTTTLGGESTKYYRNIWGAEEIKFDTVLCISFPSTVKLGPITKAGDTFSLTNDSNKGTVTVQNIFGVDVGTSYNGNHMPLFISATPSSSEYSFTGVEGGTVSVVSEGLYRFDFEVAASLTSKWEKMVNLPTVTVGSTTLDGYFAPTGSSSFQNGTDTTYTFTADFSNAVSGATLSYAVTSTTGIDTTGTLTASNNTFDVVASFDTVTVTFTATGDGVTKTMTYTITGNNNGLSKVARIGKTAGTNEYYTLEDALVASNGGTSGNIFMIADYTMYSGDHPRTTWTASNKGYTVKSGVTLLVPFDSAGTTYGTTPKVVYGSHTDPTAYRTLTMPAGIHITVASGGKIEAGGQLCSTGQMGGWNGCPTGPDGRINMLTGSTITLQNGANLYCWGYIYGGGMVEAESGSTVYEAFQVKDWRGGTETKNCYGYVFPFNQYYVQNIEAPLKLYAGASESLYGSVNASSSAYTVQAAFIGSGSSNAMFRISSGYVVKDYLENTDQLSVQVHGNVALSTLTVSGLPIVGSVDTSGYDLPITNNIKIDIQTGTVTTGQDIKFQPGSEVYIERDAKFQVTSGKNVKVYDLDDWGNFTGSAKMYAIGYSAANETTAIRSTANMSDVTIDVNGVLEVAGQLYTSASGANITSSLGTNGNNGRIVFTAAPASSTVTVYEDANNKTKTAVTFSAPKLHNGNDTYSLTQSTGASTWYYDKDGEHWYRYYVDFNYNGTRVARDYFCENNDTINYDAAWLTEPSASVTSGSATASVSGTNVNVTNVTANSVVTLTGTASQFIPTFILNENQAHNYEIFTGNTLAETRTIDGNTYYVVKIADAALDIGATFAAPTDAEMGVTSANHNGIVWNLTGVSATSGNNYGGTVPVGPEPEGEVYIYGFYTGFVAYNSVTGQYYTTLAGAMADVPQDGACTVRLVNDCGSFEEESAEWAFPNPAATTLTLDLNGCHALGRFVNNGKMIIELNGGSLEYITGASAAAATYKGMAAIINSGTMTVCDSVGGGKITCDAISNGGVPDHSAVIRNDIGGKLTVENVFLENTQDVNNYTSIIFNCQNATITSLTNVTMRSPRGYAIFNYGGHIALIDSCDINVAYGIFNRNIRGANAISAGYNIDYYGTIDLIKDSTITVGQYAIHNNAVITEMSGCTFTAHPDSAQVNTFGTTAANVQGDVQCYTVYNNNTWWYDSAVWKRTDTTSPYVRTDLYQEGEAYRPTIGTITDCIIYAENTSTNADHGCALYNNGGIIGKISGNTEIKTYKHPDNAKNIASNYALRNTAGGIIKSIEGNVTISSTGSSAVYNDGQFTTKTVNTYYDKIGGIQTKNVTTYGQPSEITSITASGTWSCGSIYALFNGGYIKTINAPDLELTGNYNVLYNSGNGSNTQYVFTRTYTTPGTASSESRRFEEYTKNTSKGGYIETLNGVTLTAKSYYALQNQGHIGTLSNVTASNTNSSNDATVWNGDSRWSSYQLDRPTNVTGDSYVPSDHFTIQSGVVTLYHYTYTAANDIRPTIDVIDNLTVTSNGQYAFRNSGYIGNMLNSTITANNSYALHNSATGYFTSRDTLRYYSGASIFTTNKNNSADIVPHYSRGVATIGTIDNCTISTAKSNYAAKNVGHIGTIKNSTITAGTTEKAEYALFNAESVEREYTDNLASLRYFVVNGANAFTQYTGTGGETRTIVYDYERPSIDLIGEGNTFSAKKNTIINRGVITTINSGEGDVTSVTATGGVGIYNYDGTLDSRNTVTTYTAAASVPGNGTAGSTTNPADTYLPAHIGTIKNVYIQTTGGNAIKNGAGTALYDPVKITEIGEGAEMYGTGNFAVINNNAVNAQIVEISGGIFRAKTAGDYFAVLNGNTAVPAYPILISGGDFRSGNTGNETGRGQAIYNCDNPSYITYPAGKKLSSATNTRTPPSVVNSNLNVSGYYYLADAYTVSFNMNGHGTAPEAQVVEKNQTATAPEEPVVGDIIDVGEDHYRFDGWYTEGLADTFDFATPITANTTVYANWTQVYKIDFNVNGTATTVYSESGAKPEYTGETPTKANASNYSYEFKGWSPEIVAAEADATYTAQFNRVYSINLDYETQLVKGQTQKKYENTGAKVKFTSTDVDSLVDFAMKSALAIQYYKLDHWTINGEGEYSTEDLAGAIKTMLTTGGKAPSELTVKAYFVRITYTIEVYSDVYGTRQKELTMTCNAGRTQWINASAALQNGTYKFAYWVIDNGTPENTKDDLNDTNQRTSYWRGDATEGLVIKAYAYYTNDGGGTNITEPKVTVRDIFVETNNGIPVVGMTLEVISPTNMSNYSIATDEDQKLQIGFRYTEDSTKATSSVNGEGFSFRMSSNWKESWISGTYVMRFGLSEGVDTFYSYGYLKYTLNGVEGEKFATTKKQNQSAYSGYDTTTVKTAN